MYNQTHVRAFRRDWADAIDLFIFTQEPGGTRSICTGIKMQVIELGMTHESPLTLDRTSAQELMDSLWNCGIRPTEGEGSAGQSASQQSHIKDLREISTRLLGIVEKKVNADS